MSIDYLQERIRKTKNPAILEITSLPDLPKAYQDLPLQAGFGGYCRDLLEALKGKIPGVRFGFGTFALLGDEGLSLLSGLLQAASDCGYYVLLDAPEMYSASAAGMAAEALLGQSGRFPCDGVVLPAYPGSDIWKPFLPYCGESKKDLFVAVRTGNRSASELQDLLAGGRLVHTAAADYVNRYGGEYVGKCGYSRVSVTASASFPEGMRGVRARYSRLFQLIDGLDAPGANLKNCSYAFDKLGHGAAICTGKSILCAWENGQSEGEDCLEQACAAADRIRRNIARYVSIL